jgi:hypothetical protein
LPNDTQDQEAVIGEQAGLEQRCTLVYIAPSQSWSTRRTLFRLRRFEHEAPGLDEIDRHCAEAHERIRQIKERALDKLPSGERGNSDPRTSAGVARPSPCGQAGSFRQEQHSGVNPNRARAVSSSHIRPCHRRAMDTYASATKSPPLGGSRSGTFPVRRSNVGAWDRWSKPSIPHLLPMTGASL